MYLQTHSPFASRLIFSNSNAALHRKHFFFLEHSRLATKQEEETTRIYYNDNNHKSGWASRRQKPEHSAGEQEVQSQWGERGGVGKKDGGAEEGEI